MRLTDRKLLEALLDSEKLTEVQNEAFTSMLEKLDHYKALTKAQRKWAEDVHHQLDLELPAENLVSSGKVKITKKEKESLNDFLGSLGPKVLKPPGRA